MAILNLDYYTEKDFYSDGDIEERLLWMARQGIPLEDLPKDQIEFPMLYHFSDLRKNILCWYPLKETDSVLEIGSGCGAITGMLCEKAGSVTSVELSKRRATVNYERHKNRDNLTVMVGNLNDMEFSAPFDYVVLTGVLEYAMSFTRGERPYEAFLKRVGTYLKPEGKLLIAIENKLGLKYFAGAPEDHTDISFLGVNGYPDNDSVRTFSKDELTRLLESSGFSCCHYYYPYPDYKFPTEIFTDASLYQGMYGKGYPVYTDGNVRLFSEEAAARSLEEEGILDRFVNSFLVEAGRKPVLGEPEILYVKLNQGRKKQFRTLTRIVRRDGRTTVEKEALTLEAVPFVRRMEAAGRRKLPEGYANLPCTFENRQISYEYLQGETLHQKIADWTREGDLESIKRALKAFYTSFFSSCAEKTDYQTEPFRQVFGEYPGKSYYACVCPANIDLICANIFPEGTISRIIDYEWEFPFAVPVSFIMWRLLHELYSRIPGLNRLCLEETMMKEFDIGYSDQEIFMQWTLHFVYQYAGSDFMDAYRKEQIPVSLSDLAEAEFSKTHMRTKLYYDRGKGLNEEDTIEQVTALQGNRFRIVFDLSKLSGVRALRWNPANGQFCRVQIDRIDCGQSTELLPWGPRIEVNDSTTVFFTTDAYYFLHVWDPARVKQVLIEGRIHYPDQKEIEAIMLAEQERREQEERERTEAEALRQRMRQQEQLRREQEQENQPVPMGKKEKLKQLVKQMLGRDRQPEPTPEPEPAPPTTCVGSVDCFSYEDHNLNVVGWAFDTAYPMERPHIAFYRDGEKIQEDSYSVIYRKDVAAVLNNPEAEAGGFSYVSIVQTPADLEVFFEYDTQDGPRSLRLGAVGAEAGVREVQIFSLASPESIGNIEYFCRNHLRKEKWIYPPVISQETVDVIIPIYNGLQYFDALFAGIERTRMSFRLFLVDDHSPDPEAERYLRQYAAAHKNVTLLRNEENMGFVRSVNRALAITEHSVALVNTDVELPDEWMERLMLPILTKEKVASSTPFTNCGTICSFPNFCEDNGIFEGMPLWQVDDVFRRIDPQYPAMPTGVGFCMGMSRQAILEVGFLDTESFGKGYCEENDWCQRAIKAGYTNVHVDNLFVWHKHGGSFPSEEKQRLIEQNTRRLTEKHPDYLRDTAEYCRRDPARTVRLYAQMKLLNQKLEVPTILAFDHVLGGGATEYLEEKKKEAVAAGKRFLTVRFDVYSTRYYFTYEYGTYRFDFFAKELEMILEQLQRVDEIWVNELVTYQNLYATLERIVRLKQEQGAYLKLLLHDYFALCPAVNLMDAQGAYCGAAGEEVCNGCIPKNRSNACLEYGSGTLWRHRWKEFLTQCDELLAFSDSTAELFKKVYPDVYHLRVIPHKPHYLLPLSKKAKTTKSFQIGLLGVLCYKKGLSVVQELAAYIEKHRLNIRIRLIGVSDEEIDSPVFSCTGRYRIEQLPRLTLEQDIDLFLIPSIWPETFSYTASEIMSMNLPLAVLPLGAPVERVKHYDKGLVLSGCDPETMIREMTEFMQDRWKETPVQEKRVLFIGEEISFASRYRVEHFREQLYLQGYGSDFVKADEEIPAVDPYAAVVIYRCSQTELVERIVRQAGSKKTPVYYDIDDLIFDYDKISGLSFLQDEEYADFQEKTQRIHQCMELCGGYLTSTETLAEEIRRAFPDKPVVVNRNCASMEMQILSHQALERVHKDPNRIWIGYFSGSKTHDQDFSIVEDALIKLMENYPQVSLKLGGVFYEERMKQLGGRVERLPFMEWQKLPEVIGGIDINLMPLEDSLFHCCKSENKWMEAALVKVPSVMSRNRELEQVVTDGEIGWLCSTKEEWYQALERAVTDPKERRRVGERAYEAAMDRYVTQKTGNNAREELLCKKSYLK